MADRVDAVYGKSGTGKSRWIVELAKRVYKEQQKITRVYLSDGGGDTYVNSGLVEAGILKMCQFNIYPFPFETSRAVAEGQWPDDKGTLAPLSPSDRAETGLWAFEGGSTTCDYLMGDTEGGLSDRASKGERIGQDSPITIKDGKAKVGGNPPSHYNVAQRAFEGLIERSRALPGIVYWTFHERMIEGDKEVGNLVGPDCAGKALTAKIGAKFGNTIHLVIAHKPGVKNTDAVTGKQVQQAAAREFRAYTTEHYDPDGVTLIKYYANNRCPVVDGKVVMPEFIAADPVKFYQILENAKFAALKETAAKVGYEEKNT